MNKKDYSLLITRRGSKKAKLLYSLHYRVTRTSASTKVKSMDLEALRALHHNLGREISILERAQ